MKARAALFLVIASPASGLFGQAAQLSDAIAAGLVGERYDGYLGFAASPTEELRRQVLGVNIRRRMLYSQLASQRAVTAELVAMMTACSLFPQLPVGEAYMLKDGRWRRHRAGEQLVPDQCH